ncbi:PREDICTED: putative G3BP-like protein isoform X1 [Brassica oleracea var. oleracea]|uniref:putative G3BP-like protein isoform X1 n=1 Tax=Brassica oleracea var. oleracea TaxID=109376 RepID=UPI0006A752DF|nr:PREDICTED: putative G3BP-like protein isoform X1 [Brassica oleracea var. oleracea]XP_013598850.1 PREDICTED: putative G3BP-like protein isoform X1 [Brassica oleracea var. oleracea]
MDPAAAQVPATVVDPPVVGRAFVMQYYEILHKHPQHLHRFYHEISKVGRVGQDGVMRDFYTLEGIREELDTLSFGDFESAKITSYHTQESHSGGFIVLVTGWFTLKDAPKRKFTQTFFLAPQENGYYVLNDILRFDNGPEALDGDGSLTPFPVTGGIQGSEQAALASVDSVCKEVSKDNASVAKESILVSDSVNDEAPPDIEKAYNKIRGDSMKISDPENVSKKSYASVVAKDKSGVSAGSSPSPKQIPKDQELQVISDVSAEQKVKDQCHQVSSDLSPVEKSDAVFEAVDDTEYGYNQGFEAVAEGTSIYVKHLPGNATIDMLETEFKKFGAIGNGGVQVISQKGFGYPFGFVEFKDADAAQKAIEASPLMIGGQKAFVEEKRSTARGNWGRGYGNEYGNRNVIGDGGNGYGIRNEGGRGGGGGRYGHGNNYNRGRRGGGGGGRYFNRRGGYEYVVASNNSY